MAGLLSVPYIKKEVILEKAEVLVARFHPSLVAPIPVDLIIERALSMRPSGLSCQKTTG